MERALRQRNNQEFQMTRVLCFSTLYPNQARPNHGIFVENRLRKTLETGEITATVLAPVPYFPFRSSFWGRYADFARIPFSESRHGLKVFHPRFLTLPRIGNRIAPDSLAMTAQTTLKRLTQQNCTFDVIDAHYFYPDGVAASYLARALGKPFVVTARGSDLTQHALVPHERNRIIRAAQEATALITVSSSLKTELVKLGIPPDRIAVLRNGVDTDVFVPPDRRPPVARGRFRILSVGALIPRKAHDITIRAMATLPDCELKIVGTGEQRAELMKLIGDLGLTDRISLAGEIPHHNLPQEYGNADLSVLMSSREGWANVILESLACGTPVIASDVGGASEIIGHTAAGMVLKERTPQALAQAVGSFRTAMPDRFATRRYAEAFGWHPVASANARLLTDAAKAKSPMHDIAQKYSVLTGSEPN